MRESTTTPPPHRPGGKAETVAVSTTFVPPMLYSTRILSISGFCHDSSAHVPPPPRESPYGVCSSRGVRSPQGEIFGAGTCPWSELWRVICCVTAPWPCGGTSVPDGDPRVSVMYCTAAAAADVCWSSVGQFAVVSGG
jgi:hypothetical protein